MGLDDPQPRHPAGLHRLPDPRDLEAVPPAMECHTDCTRPEDQCGGCCVYRGDKTLPYKYRPPRNTPTKESG